jgi:hypothetical protein
MPKTQTRTSRVPKTRLGSARRPSGYLMPLLYLFVWVIREDYEMRFNGCTCKVCKGIAVGAAGLVFANYVYPTAYGDECWDQPKVKLYCQSFVPEQPHTHNDHQPPINWVRSLTTVASSTSSSSTTMVNHWSFKPIG